MTFLTRQTFPFPGLQQNGPLSVQVSWLTALTQVGLRNVLPVDAHAVYMLPGTKTKNSRRLWETFNSHFASVLKISLDHRKNRQLSPQQIIVKISGKQWCVNRAVTCTCHSRSCSRHREWNHICSGWCQRRSCHPLRCWEWCPWMLHPGPLEQTNCPLLVGSTWRGEGRPVV